MAYLRKLPNSPNWIACFLDGKGRLRNRSTRIRDAGTPKERADARRRAQTVADTLERASRGSLKRESQIRDTLLELVALVGNPAPKIVSAREFFDSWIARAESARKSKTSIARYRQVARDFTDSLGDKATAPFEEITDSDVKDYVDALEKAGRATKSISNVLKILRIPFAEACRLGKLTFNPAAAVKAPEIDSIERIPFEAGEIKLLLEATTGFENGAEWRTAVMLGYFCGMRLGDATSLSWGAIDFHRRAVKYIPEKTRKKRKEWEIPMHPSLEKYLHTLTLPDDPKALLTPALCTPAGGRAKLSKTFEKIVRAAGIENVKERHSEQGRAVSTKCFHTLRHSLASHLANAGVSAEIRMKFTGHSDLTVHAGYTHTELSTLRAALEMLPK